MKDTVHNSNERLIVQLLSLKIFMTYCYVWWKSEDISCFSYLTFCLLKLFFLHGYKTKLLHNTKYNDTLRLFPDSRNPSEYFIRFVLYITEQEALDIHSRSISLQTYLTISINDELLMYWCH